MEKLLKAGLLCLFFSVFLAGQECRFTTSLITREGVELAQDFRCELFVQYRAGVPAMAAKNAVSQGIAASVIADIRPVFAGATLKSDQQTQAGEMYLLHIPGGQQAVEMVERQLAADPTIEWVSRSPVVKLQGAAPLDPGYPEQWNLRKVRWPEAMDDLAGHAVRANIYYFSIDSGCDTGNQEFVGRIFWAQNYLEPTKPVIDKVGHGTAVASIIVANGNNNVGITGIDPRGRIACLQVFDERGEGSFDLIIKAMLASADKFREIKKQSPHARGILTMSFGAYGILPAMQIAVDYCRAAGMVLVAASGNNDVSIDLDANPVTPASLSGVIAVGGIEPYGRMIYNYGRNTVVVLAPARSVPVILPVGSSMKPTKYLSGGSSQEPDLVDGTSFAVPHVAAAIGLMLQRDPSLSLQQITIRLKNGQPMLSQFMRESLYEIGQVIAGAGYLDLRSAVIVDNERPMQPVLQVLETGHGSVKLSVSGSESPFGLAFSITEASTKLNFTESLVWTAEVMPFRGQDGSDSVVLINERLIGFRFKEGKTYNITAHAIDGVGNSSSESFPVSITMGRSQLAVFEDFRFGQGQVSTADGPAGQVLRSKGRPNSSWMWSPSLGIGSSWKVQVEPGRQNDSVLELPVYDLRGVNGSATLLLTKSLWMRGFGLGPTGTSWDAAEIYAAYVDHPGMSPRYAGAIPMNDDFTRPDLLAVDVSGFVGKRVRFQVRLYSAGSSAGFCIVTGVGLRLDDNQRLPAPNAPRAR